MVWFKPKKKSADPKPKTRNRRRQWLLLAAPLLLLLGMEEIGRAALRVIFATKAADMGQAAMPNMSSGASSSSSMVSNPTSYSLSSGVPEPSTLLLMGGTLPLLLRRKACV